MATLTPTQREFLGFLGASALGEVLVGKYGNAVAVLVRLGFVERCREPWGQATARITHAGREFLNRTKQNGG